MPTAQTHTSATTRSKQSGVVRRRSRDASTLLKADHKEVSGMFRRYKSADGREKAALAEEICAALTVHATIEEEIFYPAAREALADSEDLRLLDEAAVEHDVLKYLIESIRGFYGQDDLVEARVIVLGEYVKHHVKEEEDELMPKLKHTDLDMKTIGEQLERRKMELSTQEDSETPRGRRPQ